MINDLQNTIIKKDEEANALAKELKTLRERVKKLEKEQEALIDKNKGCEEVIAVLEKSHKEALETIRQMDVVFDNNDEN